MQGISMIRIHQDEQGFTLPELLVAGGVIVVFAMISIAILRPHNSNSEAFDGQRNTNIAMLAQALQRYKADKGQYPADIPATKTGIGSLPGKYPLCPVLVPYYLPDLPVDPEAGGRYRESERLETLETCNTQDVNYDLGYDIVMKDGAVTLSAPNAKNEKIELTIN
jgi:type II secretory pathway pseudopilin PulG